MKSDTALLTQSKPSLVSRFRQLDPNHPCVVDHDAAVMLDEATAAVKRIQDKRAEMDAQGRQDETLVTVIGEKHDMPAARVVTNVVLNAFIR